MYGPDFQTVDGAFHRVADLDRWRRAGLDPTDLVAEAKEAVEQLQEAGGLLLLKGFSGREFRALRAEMDVAHEDPWEGDA
jgi:hypothetical protein